MTTALVANRAFTLVDVSLEPGQPIPTATWDGTPEQNRRAMVRTRFVVRPDEYAGPAWVPQEPKAPTARKQRARKG